MRDHDVPVVDMDIWIVEKKKAIQSLRDGSRENQAQNARTCSRVNMRVQERVSKLNQRAIPRIPTHF